MSVLHRDINKCVSYPYTPCTVGFCTSRDESRGSLPSRGFLSNELDKTQVASGCIR